MDYGKLRLALALCLLLCGCFSNRTDSSAQQGGAVVEPDAGPDGQRDDRVEAEVRRVHEEWLRPRCELINSCLRAWRSSWPASQLPDSRSGACDFKPAPQSCQSRSMTPPRAGLCRKRT
jgi:hypothetical protein